MDYITKKINVGDAQILRFRMFISKVDFSGDCWIWTASKNQDGYGHFENKEQDKAHRYSYTKFVGEIPDGLMLDHLCRNRACVRPSHLEAVTPYENMARGESPHGKFSRQTHCLRGHLLAGDNLYTGKGYEGRRVCRACCIARCKEYKKRKKEMTDGMV